MNRPKPALAAKKRRLRSLAPWAFLALPLAIYLLMVAYPIVYSVVLSFTRWDGISPDKLFVGLQNFFTLFDRELLPLALRNNLIWMALFVPLPIIIGFTVAVALQRNTTTNLVLRSVFYLPMVLSFTVMAIMWSWVYEPTRGVITQVAQLVGLSPPARSLLTRPDTSLLAIVIVGVWHWVGFPLVLYVAALKEIPKELIETADIDGASWLQKLRHVIIPLVKHATLVAISIGIVLSVKVFDLVFLMAGGYYKDEVMSTLIWKLAFNRYQVGSASAVAIVQFAIVLVILVPYISMSIKREVEF